MFQEDRSLTHLLNPPSLFHPFNSTPDRCLELSSIADSGFVDELLTIEHCLGYLFDIIRVACSLAISIGEVLVWCGYLVFKEREQFIISDDLLVVLYSACFFGPVPPRNACPFQERGGSRSVVSGDKSLSLFDLYQLFVVPGECLGDAVVIGNVLWIDLFVLKNSLKD